MVWCSPVNMIHTVSHSFAEGIFLSAGVRWKSIDVSLQM